MNASVRCDQKRLQRLSETVPTNNLDEECQDLLKQYEDSGDPDIADQSSNHLTHLAGIVGKN